VELPGKQTQTADTENAAGGQGTKMQTKKITVELPLRLALDVQAAADQQRIPLAVLISWLIEDEVGRQKRRNALDRMEG